MNLGLALTLVSLVTTFFGTLWTVKNEQGKLRQEVETRLTKLETDITWVVSQSREKNKLMQAYYMKGKHDEKEDLHDDGFTDQ